MKGFVDKSICRGCMLCSSLCPGAFKLDVDGLAKAREIEIPALLKKNFEEAKTSCPVKAISVK